MAWFNNLKITSKLLVAFLSLLVPRDDAAS
jgi:hypothetical protein